MIGKQKSDIRFSSYTKGISDREYPILENLPPFLKFIDIIYGWPFTQELEILAVPASEFETFFSWFGHYTSILTLKLKLKKSKVDTWWEGDVFGH